MKDIYLDYLDEPKNSERRKLQDGIYTSYFLGKKKQIKIILLDVRYNKNPKTDDMLGKNQWEWFEKELNEKTVNFKYIK